MRDVPSLRGPTWLPLLLAIASGCGRPSVEPADVVLKNARIVTVDPARPEAQALPIKGETIVAIGTDAEIAPHEDANLPGVTIAPTFDDAIRDADAILFLVKHTEFTELSPADVAKKTKTRIAIDTVNGWDATQWQAAGFPLVKLGSGKSPE